MNTLISIFMMSLAALHPVHVSYTSLDITAETGEIGLVYKFFTDDLKLLFYHYYERELPFDPAKDLTADEVELIRTYIFSSFFLKEQNGKAVDFSFVRKEQNDESVWLYFSGKLDQKTPETLTVTNKLLLDLFEDQTNLVIITNGKNEKGYRFNYLAQELQIEMKN